MHQKKQTAETLSHSQQASFDKRIDQLFLRFATIYGHLWSNLYKSEEFLHCTKQEWQAGLQSFENVILGKALERCRESIHYPPTLPVFIDICRSFNKKNVFYVIKDEKDRSDPTIACFHLDHMRSILKTKGDK